MISATAAALVASVNVHDDVDPRVRHDSTAKVVELHVEDGPIAPRIEPLKTVGLTLYFIYLGYSLNLEAFRVPMLLPIVFGVALIVAGRPLLMRLLGRWAGLDAHGSSRFGFTINQGSEFSMILAATALAAGLFDSGTFLVVLLICVVSLVIGAWTHERPHRHGASPEPSA